MKAPIPAVETLGLGKRYGRTWGLRDCSFRLPPGRVAGLVGPNGAGKSTLLRMLAGMSTPSAGEMSVLGRSPMNQSADVLARIGYLDQERPLYRSFRVSEMLRFGRELNPRWDDARARRHLDALAIDPRSRIGELSGGQQAQVALIMCLAKRPELLLLDEPVAALDPPARRTPTTPARVRTRRTPLTPAARSGPTCTLSSSTSPPAITGPCRQPRRPSTARWRCSCSG